MMDDKLGDRSFSDLLHTPFSQLPNRRLAREEMPFVVYDISTDLRPMETLTLDGRIDEDSRVMFKTFEATFRQVFSLDMTNPYITPMQMEKSTYDYSSLVALLSQIWELELNNSIVQIIRKMRGIEMPLYYKRVKRDENNRPMDVFICIGKHRKILLNEAEQDEYKPHDDDKLKPCMMGDIWLLINRHANQLSRYLKVNYKEFEVFMEKIKEMKEYRNMASHPYVVQENDFKTFYEDIFCELIKKGWLVKMMDGKESVRMKASRLI